jgi:hypothetical protein
MGGDVQVEGGGGEEKREYLDAKWWRRSRGVRLIN